MKNLFSLLLCLILYGLAFVVPHSGDNQVWVPLVAGLVEEDFLASGGVWSILAALLSALMLSYGTFCLLDKERYFRSYALTGALVTFALIMTDQKSILFNQLYPVVMLNYAAGCYFLKRKYMNAFMLLSCSSLFYIPVVWVLPICLFILFLDTTDTLRNFAKAIAGILLPYIYIVSLRFILFGDALLFLEANWQELNAFGGGFYKLPIPSLFFILCLLATALYAMWALLSRLSSMETEQAKVVRFVALDLILGVAITLLYISKNGLPATILFSISFGSMLAMCGAVLKSNQKYLFRVLLLFLVIAAVLMRSAHFVSA